MTTVTRSIRFTTKDRRKRAVVATSRDASPPSPESPGGEAAAPDAAKVRVPRVAHLMALAIRFDQLLRDGVVANQTELARLARVTQPRMTQIMNLLHLAPDIQEAVLMLPPTRAGSSSRSARDRVASPLTARTSTPRCARSRGGSSGSRESGRLNRSTTTSRGCSMRDHDADIAALQAGLHVRRPARSSATKISNVFRKFSHSALTRKGKRWWASCQHLSPKRAPAPTVRVLFGTLAAEMGCLP